MQLKLSPWRLITVFVIISCQSAVSQGINDFLVTIKGDTVYGNVGFRNAGIFTKSYVTVATVEQTQKFPFSDVKHAYKGGLIYKQIDSRPGLEGTDQYFTAVIMQHNDYELYDRPDEGSNPGSRSHRYYLYKSDRFLYKVKSKNYRETLTKYFGHCNALLEELNRKKNYFSDGRLYKLSIYYRENCN